MKLPRRRFLRLTAGAVVLPALPRVALALDYPTRPVRIIVPLPAGTTTDIVARLVGEPLSKRIGQAVIIDDRPGVSGNLAAEAVVRAAPDGYTLLMAFGANAINAVFYPNLKFDFVHDIAPVAIVGSAPFVLAINPVLPAKTVPEFIAYAKANPGKINMASPGVGTVAHLAIELLKTMAGIDLVHVSYRDSFAADLISGQVQGAFMAIAQVLEYVRGGEMRALAVTSLARVATLPDVPSLAEFVPGYEAGAWFGVVAPKATPAEIIDRLNFEINGAVASEIKPRLVSLGAQPLSMTPAEFGKMITDYTEKWARVIRAANIKPE